MKYSQSPAKLLIACMLFASLAACSMVSGRETPGQYLDDTTITTTVKAKIIAEPKLKVLQINVETMQGVVQLSGFVDSKQHGAKAVEIARKVRGVTSVKDDLVVRP
ncbi:MAG: BON domain-containing protein [Bdellovibrionales bacterium]